MLRQIFLNRHDRKLISQSRLTGPMLYVIAIMVFLTVLAVAGGLMLQITTDRISSDLDGRASVQIIEAGPAARAKQVEAATAMLKQSPMVEEVIVIPPERIEAMLTPWLGSEGLDEDIPVPGMIDIILKDKSGSSELKALESRLQRVAPEAHITAHAEWLKPVARLISSLQWLSLALVILLAFTTLVVVILIVNVALKNHGRTIAIIHLLGGTDTQIARLFQRRVALDATMGALLGFCLAALVLVLLMGQAQQLGSAMLEPAQVSPLHWAILAMVPVTSALLALWAARITVMRALRKML